MVVMSLPFAATERLFYPHYWKPRFLFDLVDYLGFGLEDILFVAGLAAFSSTGYAFVTGRTVRKQENVPHWLERTAAVLVATALFVTAFRLANIEIIYGSVVTMLLVSALIVVVRIDLFVPALLGGAITLAAYFLLVLAYRLLIPDVFLVVWNTESFSNRFVAGIPLEELMYGFAAGAAATVVYPFVFRRSYVTMT
jgi:hypothetical protein